MFPKLKALLANLGLSAAALGVTCLFLEFVVFGVILKPDDLLENVTVNGVVRYKADTRATFRHPGLHTSNVTINRDGWNSVKAIYERKKTPGRVRVAVVGDSYVHGAFVNVEQGFAHLMERGLRGLGHDVEVYRFGMDGAPLSQYLNMMRREVLAYNPDVIVVPLIHNDFDESYRFLKTRYASSFLKLERGDDGRVVEVEPAPFSPGVADRLRAFATFRYLYYETGLYVKMKGFVNAFFWGGNEKFEPRFIQSAVDIRKIDDHASNRFFARYVFSQMKALADRHGIKLVFVMDGVREAVYEGKMASEYEVGKLNAIAADLLGEFGIAFRDLQGAFAKDYARFGRRFEFSYDWHWNAYANGIVAREIVDLLVRERALVMPEYLRRPPTARAMNDHGIPVRTDRHSGG